MGIPSELRHYWAQNTLTNQNLNHNGYDINNCNGRSLLIASPAEEQKILQARLCTQGSYSWLSFYTSHFSFSSFACICIITVSGSDLIIPLHKVLIFLFLLDFTFINSWTQFSKIDKSLFFFYNYYGSN